MPPRLSRQEILLSTLTVEGGLVVVALVLAALLGPDLWSALSCSWQDVGWGCLAAMPPLVIILLIDRYPIGPFRHVADISEQFLRPLLKPCRWPDYILLSALAGFCEELLFRGWLQPFLYDYASVWLSVLATGLVFALCHMITPAYFIIAWLISIYLSVLLIWSNNLLVPMVAHGVYDLIAIFAVMWSVPPSKRNDSDTVEELMTTLPAELPGPWPVEPSPPSSDTAPGTGA